MSVEFYGRQDFPNQSEFRAAPVLTGHSGKDEYSAETGDNGQMQTNVCSRAKGVQSVDVAAQPGRAVGRNIGRGESVEHELDALITRRHDQRVKGEGHRPSEELWAASERAYFARRAEDRCLERLTYHEGQAARLSGALGALVAHHEAEAEKYRDQLTKGDAA